MSYIVIPGARVGRWTIGQRLGAGSFGTAWRVTDEGGRPAALKVLQTAPGDELRALTRICHPAVPAVLDAASSPIPYVCMELALGAPLSKMLRAGRAPEARAVAVSAILADALASVHHAGLTHGDVKPDNVIVNSIAEGRVWLVDFGLAGGGGGTLQYAAPEQLSSEGATPASDVYALGLMLWEMLHGCPPWAGVELSQALLLRRKETPAPTRGQPWLQELLTSMLRPEPKERPAAHQVADTMAAHGALIPQPGPDLLRRRARTVQIPRPELDHTLASWYGGGGRLALIGPAGIGRSHSLAQVITELRARGMPWVRLVNSPIAWAGVEQALADPTLPGPPVALPHDPDPGNRAETVAELLEERTTTRLSVIIDDLDDLDSGTVQVLSALVRRERVSLCTAGEHAPEGDFTVVALEPMDAAGTRLLVSRILGSDDQLEPLFKRVHTFSGGVPGPAVALLIAACERGALLYRAHRWLLDEVALASLTAEPDFLSNSTITLRSTEARVGGVLALWGLSAPLEMLSELTGVEGDALHLALAALIDRGLVRVEDGAACCASAAAAATLGRLCPDPVAVHQRLLHDLLERAEDSLVQLGWHAVGAGDEALLRSRGPAMIARAMLFDPGEATRLADAIWAICRSPELANMRLQSLIRLGQLEPARDFGAELLGDRDPTASDVPVLLALADMSAGIEADDGAAMSYILRAYRALGGTRPPLKLLQVEATTHYRAGRHRDALRVARSVARQDPPADDPAALDLWLGLRGTWAQSLQALGELAEAIKVLEDVPDALAEGRPSRALLRGALGPLLWMDGRIREAAAVMLKAAAEDAGLPAMERARMLNNCAVATYHYGDRLGALARWEDALLLFERLGSALEQVRVSVNLCAGYREAGRWERARQAGQWAFDAAIASEDWDLAAMSAGNMGDLDMSRGRYDDAEGWFNRAGQLARDHDLEGERVELARRRAELAVLRDDAKALMAARGAVKLAKRANNKLQGCLAHALVAVALARRGQTDKVDAELRRAMEPLRETGASGELAWVRLWAGEAYIAIGRVRDAMAECDRVAVYAEEMGHVPMRARADELMARCVRLTTPDSQDQRLDRLLELAVAVSREQDLEILLGTIAEAALELLQGDRSFLLLLNECGTPRVAAARAAEGEEPGVPSMSVVERCLAGGREIIAADLGERGDLRAAQSVLALDLRSAMCVPLIERGETLGAIYVDSRLARESDLSGSARFMRALASQAAVAVVNARHLREVARRAESAAEVAHDLKSPAATILTITRDLQQSPYDEAHTRESLNAIVELGRRSIAMVRNFMDERDDKPLDLVNLGRVTGSLVELMTREACGRDLTLEWSACEVPFVLGDSDELGRVLMNLLQNAMKYSPPASAITVELTREGDQLFWTVRDRGPGLPEEQLSAIFDRGVQVAGARPGYGLGLHIVKKTIEELGGRVEAHNHPGGGAVFCISLPAAREAIVAA